MCCCSVLLLIFFSVAFCHRIRALCAVRDVINGRIFVRNMAFLCVRQNRVAQTGGE